MLNKDLYLKCNQLLKNWHLSLNSENSVNSVKKSPAFTLLELLVAMAVLSIILVVLMNVVQSATALWRNSENRMETYREARAALQVMASDLANFLPSTNIAHFRTNISSTNQLAFLAMMPQSSQGTGDLGDVCAVGYFVGYGSKSPIGAGGAQACNLHRFFLGSNATFSNLSSGSTPFPATDFAPSGNNTEILARNVLNFSVKGLATNATGLTNWIQTTADPAPDLLEIEILAINNERANRLKSESDWDDFRSATNTSDFQKNTKTFTKRIKLNTQ